MCWSSMKLERIEIIYTLSYFYQLQLTLTNFFQFQSTSTNFNPSYQNKSHLNSLQSTSTNFNQFHPFTNPYLPMNMPLIGHQYPEVQGPTHKWTSAVQLRVHFQIITDNMILLVSSYPLFWTKMNWKAGTH